MFGDAVGQRSIANPDFLYLLAPANQSFLLVANNDGSNMDSGYCFTHGLSACPALPWTRSVEGLLFPFQALMASREPGENAFTWHLQGRDLHPQSHSVVKALFGIAPPFFYLATIPPKPPIGYGF